MDITVLKSKLLDRIQSVAEHLLPNGIKDHREWVCGSIGGEAGRSLKLCLSGSKAGVWSDFSDGGAGDLIDLWMGAHRVSLVEALDEIREWLGVEKPKFENHREKPYRRPTAVKGQSPKAAVMNYLVDERLISDDAINVYRLREDDRFIVFPSFLPEGELAFVKKIGLDRNEKGRRKIWVEPDCEPILFGWQAIAADARTITLTEGEIDACTSWDYSFPALSVPFGGGKGEKQRWIEAEFDRLLRFEVIYLALDMDGPGEEACQEISNRLGRHRCRRVKLPHKDLTDCRKAGVTQEQIQALFDEAETIDPPELRRAGGYRKQVQRLFHPPEDEELPGYKLPFAKIANNFRCRPAEATLWTGATGMGKSQVLSDCEVEWIQQGARICEASLEMSPAQQLRRKVRQAGNIERPTPQFVDACMDWLDRGLWLVAVQGKMSPKRMLEIFDYARCRHGCDVFVVDSLMRLGIAPDDYNAQEAAIYDLVTWTVANGVHMHIVAHARKSDPRAGSGVPDNEDVKGTSEITNNAFNVIGIWRNKKLEEELRIAEAASNNGSVEAESKLAILKDKPTVVMNIAKQRNGDWEGKVGLWFDVRNYQYRSAWDRKEGRQYVNGDDLTGPERPMDEYLPL